MGSPPCRPWWQHARVWGEAGARQCHTPLLLLSPCLAALLLTPLSSLYLYLSLQPSLDPKLISARATEKWVSEFKYYRATATGNLARFMDFVAYEYLIDNILDLIKAATSSQSVDMDALEASCHPLGKLDPAVMKTITAFSDLGEDFHALYRTVLVDTPVGKYFTQFMQVSNKRHRKRESLLLSSAPFPSSLHFPRLAPLSASNPLCRRWLTPRLAATVTTCRLLSLRSP